MATLTASTFEQGPRSNINGVVTRVCTYNGPVEASAQTIFLCKIPNRATIIDVSEHHSSGAATSPVDVGIDGSLSAFISQGTTAVINRLNVGANLGYTVSLSDDAALSYSILKATPTIGTATTSFKLTVAVSYTLDK